MRKSYLKQYFVGIMKGFKQIAVSINNLMDKYTSLEVSLKGRISALETQTKVIIF